MAMQLPSFDGLEFSSVDGCGNGFSAMTCAVSKLQGIIQEVHFDGYDGSKRIHHGYNNRPWVAAGKFIRNNQADLTSFIADFESYIDDDWGSTWRVLVDSMGNTWSRARITSVTAVNPQAFGDSLWGCDLIIEGVIDGSPVMPGS